MPVWIAEYSSARGSPASRAAAAIAETQGEHASMNTAKAAAEGTLIAAANAFP